VGQCAPPDAGSPKALDSASRPADRGAFFECYGGTNANRNGHRNLAFFGDGSDRKADVHGAHNKTWGTESRPMRNYLIYTANYRDHLKIVVVSLIASIIVVAVGIAARPSLPDMSTVLEARAPILKAGEPVIWSGSDQIKVR